MPTVRLIGHQFNFQISDVLRLFYGPEIKIYDDCLTVGDEQPLIISSLRSSEAGINQIETCLPERIYSATVSDKLVRREVKRQLYQCLSDLTGLKFPWGSLTGIRPTQVAAESIAYNTSLEAAGQELTDHWYVSPAKADLAIETALTEQRLLGQIPPDSALVYLGVPFCPSRCDYCSFIAQDALQRVNMLAPYVEAVIAETDAFFAGLMQSMKVSVVYVGGGTPTSLPDHLFARLLDGVLSKLPCLPNFELTIEAGRPDTITPSKLQIIQSVGANRICINPQTFHDSTLARIGRRHSTQQTIDALRLARGMGFDNINMDLIAGLPGETPADFAESLEQAMALGPDSITIHSLSMKRSSRLIEQQKKSGVQAGLPDPALAAMIQEAGARLKAAGLLPYYLYRQKDVAGGLENTGFATNGEGCLYNVGMMSDQRSVIGLGSGAISKKVAGNRVVRTPNPRDIVDYIARTEELAERKLAMFNSDMR